jgi:hypothetical protein
LAEFEKFYGRDYRFGDLSVSEFQQRISEFKLDLMAFSGHGDPAHGPSRGEHSTSWHGPGKEIGAAIMECLTQLGCRGSISLSDEASASVVVATRVVNYVFSKGVSPAAFVSAMRERKRKKLTTPLDSLPFDLPPILPREPGEEERQSIIKEIILSKMKPNLDTTS